MPKISQMSHLRSINETIKGLKTNIKTTPEAIKGVKKTKTLIRLEKHINKAIKGLHSLSQTTTGRTHKRGKKYKTSLKFSSQDVEDNTCKMGLSPFEDGDVFHDSDGIAQDRSLTVKGFGFPNSSQSAMGCTPPIIGKDFFPSYNMSEKVSSPDDNRSLVNGDDTRRCNIGLVPTKRRSGLPPSDIPDITIQKIQMVYGFTRKVPVGFSMRIKRAALIRKGFGWNTNDPDFTKKELINLENGIHRSACFYTAANILPPQWKYDPTIADALFEA